MKFQDREHQIFFPQRQWCEIPADVLPIPHGTPIHHISYTKQSNQEGAVQSY